MIATAPYTVHLPVVHKPENIPLGTCVHPSYWTDSRYLEYLQSRYKVITPEVAGGYWWVYGGEDYPAYGWGDMDAIYRFAQANKKRLIGYPLRFWFPNATVQPPNIEAWITEAMERYPLIVDWNVVNEGYWDGNPKIPLIEESYQIARRVRPDARLFYNGLFIQSSECDIVLGMIDRGLIDCVGIQCHHDLSSNMDRYIPFICELNARSIPWHVSELDVSIAAMDDTLLELQAEKYADALHVCIGYRGEDLSMWGVADCVSWLPTYPLPLDKDYQPKPAWAILTGD